MPPVIEGEYSDLNLEGENPVLENYVVDTDQDMFYVDDHNHVLAGWTTALYEGHMDGETLLVHVDFHEDRKQPPQVLASGENNYGHELPDEVPISMHEVNNVVPDLQINEFIEPALQWGLFDQVWNIGLRQKTNDGYRTDIDSINELNLDEYDSIISDVDIDFYMGLDGKRHSYEPETVAQFEEQIASVIAESDFTTWATSPGFMEQKEAIEKIQNLTELSTDV